MRVAGAGASASFLAVLGPSLLAGLSNDDPAGITTYSILGAQPSEGSQIAGIRKWSPAYPPKIYQPAEVDRVHRVRSRRSVLEYGAVSRGGYAPGMTRQISPPSVATYNAPSGPTVSARYREPGSSALTRPVASPALSMVRISRR